MNLTVKQLELSKRGLPPYILMTAMDHVIAHTIKTVRGKGLLFCVHVYHKINAATLCGRHTKMGVTLGIRHATVFTVHACM